jgi:hypothetical protein
MVYGDGPAFSAAALSGLANALSGLAAIAGWIAATCLCVGQLMIVCLGHDHSQDLGGRGAAVHCKPKANCRECLTIQQIQQKVNRSAENSLTTSQIDAKLSASGLVARETNRGPCSAKPDNLKGKDQ